MSRLPGGTNEGYVPLDPGPSSSSIPPELAALEYKLKQRPSAIREPERGQPTLKRTTSGIKPAAIPGSQLPQGIRQRDKFVPLPLDRDSRGVSPARPDEQETDLLGGEVTPLTLGEGSSRVSLTGTPATTRGRITVYCICEFLECTKLADMVRIKHPSWTTHMYSDVLHAQMPVGPEDAANGVPAQDVFFFEYGVVAFWGLPATSEHMIIQSLARACEQAPLPSSEVEVDEFVSNYSMHAPPGIQNDTITIPRKQASDHQVRLAISHALAQSTKLSVYEARVVKLVEDTRHLPQDLAAHGRVSVGAKRLAQLIGKVFLQSATLNLLGSVVDTPDFFWSAPDQLQALYDRACEYLELETRAEVLNARFEVLQEMLDMLRDHKNNSHAARLEWIIIWLLLVDVLLMMLQLASLFGVL